MSFYFNVQTEKKVSYKNLSIKLDFLDLEYANNAIDAEEDIIGTKIYIPHKSTRGVTITREEGAYSIGINVIASEEDFNLAVQVTKYISELTDGIISAEDSEKPQLSRDELIATYNKDWIDQLKTLGASIFIEKIGQEQSVLSIGCCYMNYSVGPKIHSKLDASSQEAYYQSLVQHIQKTQFFDRNKYVIPNLMTVSNKGGGNKKVILVFYPTGSEFLSKADYVVFPAGEGSYEIPYDMLSAIATDKFTLVDETQYVVEPLNEAEYAQLIESIETELGKASEEELKESYSKFTADELNDEFQRITSIPNARVKIFALTRMMVLMAEYEARGLELPNVNKEPETAQAANVRPASNKKAPPTSRANPGNKKKEGGNKKPWWKFW